MSDKQSNTSFYSNASTTVADSDMNDQDINFVQVSGTDRIDAKIKDDSSTVSTVTLLTSATTTTKRIEFPATSIVDGVPALARGSLGNLASYISLGLNDNCLMSIVPNDYVVGTELSVIVRFGASTTTAGTFGWTLSYQACAETEVVASSTSTVTTSDASSAVVDELQTSTLTIPDSVLAADDILFLALELTTIPTTTDAHIYEVDIDYTAYVYI